jgi:hypothetical protein
MVIFINHSLDVGYSLSFPYGTGVLQTTPLSLLVSSLGSRHAMLQYHMTWRYMLSLIQFVTTQEKALAKFALSPQKN